MNRPTPFHTAPVIALLALTYVFALSPVARAVNPPPDGGYPNQNTAEGDNALFSLTTGTDNTATGFQALFNNTTGGLNTATGSGALQSNTTGNWNTAAGVQALFRNTTGIENTASGFGALFSNTTGSLNTATGVSALGSNTTGNANTATGQGALDLNTTGSHNTANGASALETNATGNFNTAIGEGALDMNNTGNNNTAIGFQALFSSRGNFNTAIGAGALTSNSTANNTAIGFNALLNNTTGINNIALGFKAGASLTTGNNNIDIGNVGVAGDANTIRIGKQGTQTGTFVAGIFGSTVPSGVGVVVNSSGKLGTVLSSERFKEAIRPMDKTSEAILSLQPVTFRYKQELDPEGIPQFGLVAEQVEKVNPDLVARDADGKINTVRYEAVNAMLLNEFLKEHQKVEEQGAMIAQQKKQIEALTAGLQKVTARVESGNSDSRVADDN
jgi:trimeric autotransporter adhesin